LLGGTTLIRFGDAGVWESLNNGNATFQALQKVIVTFRYDVGMAGRTAPAVVEPR
jgi:hypothetical protein